LGAIARRESGEQLTVQWNQKGDHLSLIIEGVVVVYDLNEGEVVPLQMYWSCQRFTGKGLVVTRKGISTPSAPYLR
jgi:hypothetical protein